MQIVIVVQNKFAYLAITNQKSYNSQTIFKMFKLQLLVIILKYTERQMQNRMF